MSEKRKLKKLIIPAVLIIIVVSLFFAVLKISDYISDKEHERVLDEYESKYHALLKEDFDKYGEHFENVRADLSKQYSRFKDTSPNDKQYYGFGYITGYYSLDENHTLIADGDHKQSEDSDYPLFGLSPKAMNSLYYILNDLGYKDIRFFLSEDMGYSVIFSKYSGSEYAEKTDYHYITQFTYGISYSDYQYTETVKTIYRNKTYPQDNFFEKDDDGMWEYYNDYMSYS